MRWRASEPRPSSEPVDTPDHRREHLCSPDSSASRNRVFWGRHERASPFAPALLAPVTAACGAEEADRGQSRHESPGADGGGCLTLGVRTGMCQALGAGRVAVAACQFSPPARAWWRGQALLARGGVALRRS